MNLPQKALLQLLFIIPDTTDDELKFDGKEKTETIKIPVVFVTKDAAKKYLNDNTSTL